MSLPLSIHTPYTRLLSHLVVVLAFTTGCDSSSGPANNSQGSLTLPSQPVTRSTSTDVAVEHNNISSTMKFVEVDNKSSGITFLHTDGSSGERFIIEAMSGGVALFDFDADGDADIYFLNGAPLPGTKIKTVPRNELYRNDGNWKFTNVTDESHTGDEGFGLGVAAADYDNDGYLDLYVNNYGPNVLFHNEGDGSFREVTMEAGVECGTKTGAGVSFLDFDADGTLDLYVANYVQFTPKSHIKRTVLGVPTYPGPLDYEPESDNLFQGNSDGTFTDVTKDSGIAEFPGTGMGVTSCDYDNDGDTDIFVANDVMANLLFQNDGHGRFRELGIGAGIAYDASGAPQATMGIEVADIDNDGWFDLHVTSYQRELATLYRNKAGLFEDVTRSTNAGDGTVNDVTWGNAAIDFDNDGDRDLFIAAGHTEDNIDQRDGSVTHPASNIVLENLGKSMFRNVTKVAGSGLQIKESSRGLGFSDLDNDGDLDLLVVNSRSRPTLLRNNSSTTNKSVTIRLRGVTTNRFGIGSRVRVVTGDTVRIDEVRSGRGYQSHSDLQLHFGLGNVDVIDRIEVQWLGGDVEVLEGVSANSNLTLREGHSSMETR